MFKDRCNAGFSFGRFGRRRFLKLLEVISARNKWIVDPYPLLREKNTAEGRDAFIQKDLDYFGDCQTAMKITFEWELFFNLLETCERRWKENVWQLLLSFYGVEKGEKDNIERITPDEVLIYYSAKYEKCVCLLCEHYNAYLNERHPFVYPDNWVDVIALVAEKPGGPAWMDGLDVVSYALASPRGYLKYFQNGKSNKDIAWDIFLDNI